MAILAVLAISGEYSTGMIRTTLTAMPRRLSVLGAKAVVVTALTLAAGTVGVLASMLAGRLILPGRGFTPPHGYPALSLASGPDLRAAAGSVLYLALVALLALGVATAVRDSAVSIGLVLALLYLFPVIASALNPHWSRHLEQIGPMSAGLSIQATAGCAAFRSRPGRASASSPCGRPGRCSSAGWRCDSATRRQLPQAERRPVPVGSGTATIPGNPLIARANPRSGKAIVRQAATPRLGPGRERPRSSATDRRWPSRRS